MYNIYDPLPPTVAVSIPDAASQSERQIRSADTVPIVLSAADQEGSSGVAEMQISTAADFARARWEPFHRTAQVAALPTQTIYVRVRDGVGNISNPASINVGGQSWIFLPSIVR